MKHCASHNVKLSVPLTPAGASLAEGILHAPKVCLSCRKAHLVEKKHHLSTDKWCFFSGRDSWVRTSEMTESKSVALPLGYIPIPTCLTIIYTFALNVKIFLLSFRKILI